MSASAPGTDLTAKVVAAFQQYEQTLNGAAETPLHAMRRAALDQFVQLGFPTPRHEEWKYTNVAPIIRRDYRLATQPGGATIDAAFVRSVLPADLDADLMVFVDGWYNADLSATAGQAGLTITNLGASAHGAMPAEVQNARRAAVDANGFVALNTALALDGAIITVKAGVELARPILLLNICDAQDGDAMSALRCVVQLEANARAQLIELNAARGDGHSLQTRVAEIQVARGARLDHIMLQDQAAQNYQHNHTQVDQERDSLYRNVVAALGGGFVRNDLNIALNGEAAHADMFGLSLLDDREFVDNHTLVDHRVPNCTSNELYKGIYDGRSVGVFNGKIIVRPDAQKTNAFQSNRNVLLSDGATVNTKPQLEIFADDVKCSHGATSGQFDADALFYLRSRGLSRESARTILMHAFAVEVLDQIPVEALRVHLEHQLSSSTSFDV